MNPLHAALLAGLMPGTIALLGLVVAWLLSRRVAPAPQADGPGAEADAGDARAYAPGSTPMLARLTASAAAGVAVALAFFLIQEQLKPGTTGVWPKAAINRAASLSVVCALVGVVGGLWPRRWFAAPVAIGVAGAVFAWGFGGPIADGAGELGVWMGAAAAWGVAIGGFWHIAVWRQLGEPGGAAMLAASALVPMGAAPVFFFGGGSLLPQPAMSLVAVAGATVAAMLAIGRPRIAPIAGGVAPLLASGTLLLAVAMWTNYRPSVTALAVLMAAPLGLIPAAVVRPRVAGARWGLAIAGVLALVCAAGVVAWQMAPVDEGYGY